MHEDCKYITSYFINEERTVCIVEWQSPSGELFEDAVQVTEDNALWQELLAIEGVNEDVIHENTYKRNIVNKEAYEADIKAIAKNEGLWGEFIENEEFALLKVSQLILLDDDEINNESLFKLKLKLFENKIVAESKDRTAKANIRKAKNYFEVFTAFRKFKK